MKILFYGDSITDAGRNKTTLTASDSYGNGYVNQIIARLYDRDFDKFEFINTGISGNRIVDLYARVKADLWNHKPDVISIMIGINDIWHEIANRNGVDLPRFEKVYRMLIEDTKAVLPDAKFILCEPFVLDGSATHDELERFEEVYEYAKCVKRLAEEYGLYFLPLQEVLTSAGERYGNSVILKDGVHPDIKGAAVIAKEWVKLFDTIDY